ncbi:MAG: hypothetical protein KA369_01740 [Spirochaetes bacterium]|nr:hypothetical protein [Spirochaetota bacterium]
MSNTPLERLYELLSGKRVALVFLFITAVMTVVMLRIDAELAGFGGRGLLYLQLAFTTSNFTGILSSWKSGGVDLLLSSLWLYFIHAASYAVLLASALAYFSSARGAIVGGDIRFSDRIVCLLPFGAAVVDFIGITLIYSLFTGRELSAAMVMALSVVASLKWGSLGLCLILVLKSYFSFRKAMKNQAQKSS